MHKPSLASTLRRPAALLLGSATLLAMLALAHHPDASVHPATAHDSLAYIDALAAPLEATHGAMIGLYLILAACHALFAAMLGARRAPVVLAMAAYLAGCGLVAGAALLDGFVTPQLARLYLAATGARAASERRAHRYLSRHPGTVQGGFAGHVACLHRLRRCAGNRRTTAPRAGGHGRRGGAAPAGCMQINGLWLGPSNLVALFAPQALWYAALAWALYDKKAARGLLQDHARTA